MDMISLTDRSRIHVNKGTNLRLGWTKYSDWYETIYPGLDLIYLCLLTGADCGEGVLATYFVIRLPPWKPSHQSLLGPCKDDGCSVRKVFLKMMPSCLQPGSVEDAHGFSHDMPLAK